MSEHISVRITGFLRANKNRLFTRKQIGEGIGLKKTPYLSEALDRLADAGLVHRELGQWGGFSCWYYGVDDSVSHQLMFNLDPDNFGFEVVDNG